MKKIIITITIFVCALINEQAFAMDKGFVDVFEEAAVADGNDIKTYPLSVEGEKNKVIKGDFNCMGDDICSVEITVYPKHGTIDADGNNMTFSYIPNRNFVGKDIFYYKVSNGKYTSNISKCSIKVRNSLTDKKLDEIGYSDMDGNKSEYAAVKLLESGITDKERIGKLLYFYPKACVKRITAISCISRISGKSNDTVPCLADSFEIEKNSADEVYYAYKSGIIYGDRKEENLRPEDIVTRAEFFCMLERAMNLQNESENDLNFSDSLQIPDYAEQSVKRLVSAQIINNTDGKDLRPNEPITKEEMAELLYRYMCYEKKMTEKSANMRIIEKLYPEIRV